MSEPTMAEQLWAATERLLRKNCFEPVMISRERSYWSRSKDKAYVLVTRRPNGEPKVERLDR